MFRAQDLSADSLLESYCERVGSGFCPYLIPARRAATVWFSAYHLGESQPVHEYIFYLGLLHTELLRRERAHQPREALRRLYCENVIFRFPKEEDVDGRELFAWPHWLLKILYTQADLLFGKFWLGEEEYTRDSRQVPVPPRHLLSIRSAVKPLDTRFFGRAPQLLAEHQSVHNEGSVFVRLGGIGCSVEQVVEATLAEQASQDTMLDGAAQLARLDLFSVALNWCIEQRERSDVSQTTPTAAVPEGN